jgi:hypothetical protein
MTRASIKLVFIPALLVNTLKSSPIAKLQFIYVKKIMQLTTKKKRRRTEGIESDVYKKLIAPFKNDMPVWELDGFKRVCADHKYAYIGPTNLVKHLSSKISC